MAIAPDYLSYFPCHVMPALRNIIVSCFQPDPGQVPHAGRLAFQLQSFLAETMQVAMYTGARPPLPIIMLEWARSRGSSEACAKPQAQ